MLRYSALIGLITLAAGCSTVPLPPPQVMMSEQEAREQAEARVIATARSVDEQLAELRRIVTETPADYSLGRGDVLSISVYDEEDLSLKSVPIRPDGYLSVPLIGDVKAEGLYVSDLAAEISSRLREYLVNPRVSVVVLEFRSIDYTIDGEVVEPGVYPLDTSVSVTKAIARAGGLNKGQYRASTIELADLTHAYVARDGKALPVDFVRLVREGDLRFDIELRPGDRIYIPSGLSKEVYVLGEVYEPMLFAYREDMPMSRTLAQAEGFTDSADLRRIHIIRGALQNPTVIVTDFRKVLSGQARDVALQPGDIIYVPPTGLTSLSRIMDRLLPSMQGAKDALIVRELTR